MAKPVLILGIVLALTGCGGPPPVQTAAQQDPELKPPVKIIGPDGNVINCQAGPGAFCVQR
jgi:hypothetical protein